MIRKLLRLLGIIWFWILTICISLLGIAGLSGWFNRWRTSDWVAVSGQIVSLEAANYGLAKGEPPESGRCYTLACEYTYEVDGRTYTSDRVGFEWGDAEIRSRWYRVLTNPTAK